MGKGDNIGKTAKNNANAHSSGGCAIYVRRAIQGGLGLADKPSTYSHAKDFGPFLTSCGYYQVNANGNFQNGDVAMFDSCGTHTSGHLQIYYEGGWYSDFRQKGFWPYADGSKPNYTIYRIK